ncbi:hypothetical protein QFC22_004101 [Naganishia vaughanmartiniae]|uniref:Uncharacterized protein n=1 Tax=Naganishia vaughanmartiniae TaxID=1424756 RepID=A0ACC2X4H1_9TREE|nr:hypothetical protein QFC22_004101 [Naganishia vaughanmartiniae]
MNSHVPCQCLPADHGIPSGTSSGERSHLPRREMTSTAKETLWSIQGRIGSNRTDEAALRDVTCCQLLQADSSTEHLLEKCDATISVAQTLPIGDEKRETCCRDQVEPERKLVSHDLVRDMKVLNLACDSIIGLSDGLMVPFALTAGLSSLGSSKLVYQGGFAELVSGAISMGIGGYLSAKGEQDIFRHRFTAISSKLDVACASEVHREVHKVLGPFGVKQGVSKLVAQSLEMAQGAENEKAGVSLKPDQVEGVETGMVRKAPAMSSLRNRLGLVPKPKVPTRGTSAFLVNLGEGMDEVPARRLFISAFTIGISYFLGGLIPIIPYLCVADTLHGLYWSIVSLA